MNLNMLYEKIASLPPSLLPMWGPPPVDENGKRIHQKAGCMKGIIVMHDNFFEPDFRRASSTANPDI